MKLGVITYKSCWQDLDGSWFSSGGFPLQINAISALFDGLVILTFVDPPKSGGISFAPGARVIALPHAPGSGIRRRFFLLTHLFQYTRQMQAYTRDVDVIYIPVPGDISLLGMLVGIMLRKLMIVRYGSSWEPNSQTTMMNRVTMALMRFFAGRRNVMLVSGLGAQPPAANIHWLFSTAISRAEMDAIQPDLKRGRSQPLRLAYVGRLSPEKGVGTLLQALALLKREGLGAEAIQLDLIGEGPQRGSLEKMVAKEGLDQEVHFMGQSVRKDLTRRLLQADVCVLPSLTEGFPKARLDAFLCGVPVLTTEVGFGRDVIGANNERGWVVPAGDLQALANALRRIVLEPQDWPGLRLRCRDYAERFTLDAWAEEIGRICSGQWNMPIQIKERLTKKI